MDMKPLNRRDKRIIYITRTSQSTVLGLNERDKHIFSGLDFIGQIKPHLNMLKQIVN